LTGLDPCGEDLFLRGIVQLSFLVLGSLRIIQLWRVPPLPVPAVPLPLAVFQAICVCVSIAVPILSVNASVALNEQSIHELVTEPLQAVAWFLGGVLLFFERTRYRIARRWITPFVFTWALAAEIARYRSQFVLQSTIEGHAYFWGLYLAGLVSNAALVVFTFVFRPSDLQLLQSLKRYAAHTLEVDAGDSAGVPLTARQSALEQVLEGLAGSTRSGARIVASEKGMSTLASEEEPVDAKVHPRQAANCCSRMLFWWIGGLIMTGARRPLMNEDIPTLPKAEGAQAMYARFSSHWEQELRDSSAEGRKPSLMLAIRKSFGWMMMLAGLFLLIQNAAQYVPPILLRRLVTFVEQSATPGGEPAPPEWVGYLLASGQFAALMVMTLAENTYFEMVVHSVAIPLRSALLQAVYAKAMALSPEARARTANINSVISSDLDKIELAVQMLHNLWSSPCRIIVGAALLYEGLGPAVFAGVLLVLIGIPLQTRIMARVAQLTGLTLKKSDLRVKATTEAMSGIRLVKFLGWEEAFLKQIAGLREGELDLVRRSSYARALSFLFIGLNPILLSVGTFSAFVAIDGDLNPAKAFYALSLLALLFWPLLLLPRTVSTVMETRISFNRVAELLTADEITPTHDEDDVDPGEIKLDRVTLKYLGVSGPPVLRDISLSIPPGKLVAVVGETGSGKTSFVSGILGHMPKLSGAIHRRGKVTYAPQQPWIFGGTLRENVTFCARDDDALFRETVRVCGLGPDLEKLTAGEQTELGANGVNLSGGQQQRVSIARAAYAAKATEAEIVVLDDPLSALDAHVGDEVFEQCFRTFLAGKTRLLVTNAVHVLSRCDLVVVLSAGRVAQVGTFEELRADAAGPLASMVQSAPEEPATTAVTEATTTAAEAAAASPPPPATSTPTPTDDAPLEEPDKEKVAPMKQKTDAAAGRLTEDERRAVGGISGKVYMGYLRAAGGWPFLLVLVLALGFGEAARSGASVWLSVWSSNGVGLATGEYLAIFVVLSLAEVVMSALTSWFAANGGVRAARVLHEALVGALVRAKTSFHDSHPLGRIINRFSRDVSAVDTQLIANVQLFLQAVVRLIGAIIIISTSSAYILVALVPVGVAFYVIQSAFQRGARELKRLDAVARSPVVNQFAESMAGLATIRAFGVQDHMARTVASKLDKSLGIYDASMTANRWLGVRLEFLGATVVLATGFFATLARFSVESQIVGLALTYSANVSAQLMLLTRWLTLAENSFNSVERTLEYSDAPSEAPLVIEDHRPDPEWPRTGEIEFRDVSMRYREDLPPAVEGYSAMIRDGEKIGVVGRTGAGKSSSFQMLYRMVEPFAGSVLVDGVDISTIGLHDLRRRALSIIPQTPTLFAGTMRYNLDPFGEYSTEQLMEALDKAQLKHLVEDSESGLEMEILEGGTNLSTGQRQLVCLARSLLKRARILVCDEISASLDNRSDAMLQATIRREFKDATILTVAHRLLSVIDADRIMVMSRGKIIEFDTPANLLADESSEFSSLVADTGPEMAELLHRIAKGETSIDEVYSLALSTEEASSVESEGPRQRATRMAVAALVQAILQRNDMAWVQELARSRLEPSEWKRQLFGMVNDVAATATRAAEEEHLALDFHMVLAAPSEAVPMGPVPRARASSIGEPAAVIESIAVQLRDE
jgi:ATP-binding cassette, subfamily C (CFTR/MRP), member 1